MRLCVIVGLGGGFGFVVRVKNSSSHWVVCGSAMGDGAGVDSTRLDSVLSLWAVVGDGVVGFSNSCWRQRSCVCLLTVSIHLS